MKILLLFISLYLGLSADTYSLSWKNDVLSERDYHYSNALNFTYLYDDIYSISIDQSMFTPKDIKTDIEQTDDLPYLAHLSVQLAYNEVYKDTLNKIYFTLGYIGENAYGHYVQSKFHELTSNPPPKGWKNQIDNTFTYAFGYTIADKTYKDKWFNYFEVDWVNSSNIQIGNFYTGLDISTIFRIGKNYAKNFNINNSFLGDKNINLVNFYQENRDTFGYSFSLGVAANYAYYFLPLDVGVHNVSNNNTNYREIAALSLLYQNFEFTFSYQNTSAFIKEYQENYQWGEISFMWGF